MRSPAPLLPIQLTGTAKRDTMLGLAGNDTISGGGGNDTIDGGLDNDRLNGNAGDDFVDGNSGNDYLYGGEGDDSLDGSIGTDRLYGEAGNDVLTGSDLVNIMAGGKGIDTMTGGAGSDRYYVDDSNDQIIEFLSGGTDTVYATASYTLCDNVENLVINGTDAVNGTGNTLANRLTGNAANNVLTGLAGSDRLDGGLGNDKLIGGIGRDILAGGEGAAEFQFAEFGSPNADTISDFNGAEDSIHLSSAAFSLAIGGLNSATFGLGTAATTADQRLLYNQATGDLYFDADGNGSEARQLIVSLVDGTAITYEDFFVF